MQIFVGFHVVFIHHMLESGCRQSSADRTTNTWLDSSVRWLHFCWVDHSTSWPATVITQSIGYYSTSSGCELSTVPRYCTECTHVQPFQWKMQCLFSRKDSYVELFHVLQQRTWRFSSRKERSCQRHSSNSYSCRWLDVLLLKYSVKHLTKLFNIKQDYDCTHTHTTVLLPFWNISGTTLVSRYQRSKTRKVKTSLDLLEQEMVSGSGICWAICKSAPHPRQPRQHPTTQVFYNRMPFLPPNQQHQSTEGIVVFSDITRM